MSLRLRVSLALAAVVAVAVVAAGYSIHRATESSLIAEIDADLLERSEIISNRGPEPTRGFDDEALGRLRRIGRLIVSGRVDPFESLVAFDALARVVDSRGAVIGAFEQEFTASRDPSLLEDARSAPVLHDGSSRSGAVRVVTVALPQAGFVQIARPLDEVEAVLDDLRLRTGLIGGLAIVGAALAGWFIAGAVARPVRELTEAAEQVARTGDLSLEVESSGGDEVGRLASSFQTMLGALAASRSQQRRMVVDASHELRTPLMSLRTNIDVLARGHDLGETDRAALIEDLDSELWELSEMVVELVDLAADVRSDETAVELTLEEVAGPVVERAARRNQRLIEVSVERSAVCSARPEALAKAIRNLLDNAAKFSPNSSPIRVVIDGGTLTVHDRGPGIPEAEREAVFGRFHRLDTSQDLPGSGLGLAIVADVVEAHDGSVFVTDSADGGAAVGFRLPALDN